MSESCDILRASFKGESQLDLSEGFNERLLVFGLLSDEQIYALRRRGQRTGVTEAG